ncbi:SHOCT domain-containing protein [Noviherbaspirillum suwonense]|uniref:SHOCT domain-containing protein n=1 Tax=Noviherbaspirillum suwonense TaxID=1224511 RepID=UPI0024B7DB31|nr:SHOCT domain-containing protein [Noviherbaspirillum suwonense]
MRFYQLISFTAVITLLLAGCSTTGAIKPVASSKSEFDGSVYRGETTIINSASHGGEEYRVFNQGATGFVSLQANRENAEERASKFCTQKGKSMRSLRETVSKPPHVMGNFPRVELIFECTENGTPAVGSVVGEGRLARLAMLKKLLDDGTLTKDEFEKEKQKVLNSN